jgi:hypothetical protein
MRFLVIIFAYVVQTLNSESIQVLNNQPETPQMHQQLASINSVLDEFNHSHSMQILIDANKRMDPMSPFKEHFSDAERLELARTWLRLMSLVEVTTQIPIKNLPTIHPTGPGEDLNDPNVKARVLKNKRIAEQASQQTNINNLANFLKYSVPSRLRECSPNVELHKQIARLIQNSDLPPDDKVLVLGRFNTL